MTFSNPRTTAEFNDWPLGGSRRGLCKFFVETHPKRGMRVGRQTQNPKTGQMNAVKYTTYQPRVLIVDGDDGRTYILEDVRMYSFINILRSDFMHEGAVHQGSNPTGYAELLALFG
jgi:hypothetical protein